MASSSANKTPAKLSARTIPVNPWFKLKFEASSADPLCPHVFRTDNYTVIRSNDDIYILSSAQNCCNKSQPLDLHLLSLRDATITAFETYGEKPAFIGVLEGGMSGDGASLVVIDSEFHVFSLDLQTKWWARVGVYGPTPEKRTHYSVINVSSKFFLFGGYFNGPHSNDLWVLDLGLSIRKPSWALVELSTPAKPSPRSLHLCVRYGHDFVMFGGSTISYRTAQYLNDTWSFDTEARTWSNLQCAGPIPPARHRAAGTVVNGVICVYGGYNGSYCGDLWAFDLPKRQWHKIKEGMNPGSRCAHSAVEIDRKFYIFGGAGSDRSEVDVLDIDLLSYPIFLQQHQEQEASEGSTSQPHHDDTSPPPRYDEGGPSSPADCDDLASLLALLRSKKHPILTLATLDPMRKLLSMSNYASIASQIDLSSDIEILRDFLLCLLDDNVIPDVDRKARRLMLKLVDAYSGVPDSLFLSGIRVDEDHKIRLGELGSVVGGELQGKKVALKLLSIPHPKGFLKELLTWRTLRHQNVLLILGLHGEVRARKRLRYLVIPEMENGTLSQWRKERSPAPEEIERLMLQVAEGLQYIHSQRTIHGDLRGSNILLDSGLNAKIINFGMIQQETISKESQVLSPNFAAPELFSNSDDDDDLHDLDNHGRFSGRTEKSDVFAFGRLYYEVHFNTIPFEDARYDSLVTLVTKDRVHPKRLKMPDLSDEAWLLMRRCWRFDWRRRPTMEDVVDVLADWGINN